MSKPPFVGYVRDANFHDGLILAVEHSGSSASVRVRGASGKIFMVAFGGVRAVRANEAGHGALRLERVDQPAASAPLRLCELGRWSRLP